MSTPFGLGNLVCEVDRVDPAQPYHWYELSLVPRAASALADDAVAAHVIAATELSGVSVLPLFDLLGSIVTHVQFEAPAGTAKPVLAELANRGRKAIPALHLTEPPADQATLHDHAQRLAELGTDIVKLVYPALTWKHVRFGLDLLGMWPDDGPRLSLTPAGDRQGRVAAALAGSALVYVPLVTAGDRMAASWWRDLVDLGECAA